jgi:hypothetical protein
MMMVATRLYLALYLSHADPVMLLLLVIGVVVGMFGAGFCLGGLYESRRWRRWVAARFPGEYCPEGEIVIPPESKFDVRWS